MIPPSTTSSSMLLICLCFLHAPSATAFSSTRPHHLISFPVQCQQRPTFPRRLFVATPADDFPKEVEDSDCPKGYYLNSVQNTCTPLGPLGRISQAVENCGPLQKASRSISNLFGVDTKSVSKLGVAFALSYSIISNINGSITLSIAWYMSCKRTGLSPLAPGQWKTLLSSYGTLYAAIQLLRPFRVAAAVAMSKLSKEFLEQTEERTGCSRKVSILIQYSLGWLVWLGLATIGVVTASLSTGVPIR